MTYMILLEADVSPAVRRRWIARVKNAQRAIGRLEEKSAKAVRGVLGRAKGNIIAALEDASLFGQWFLPQSKKAVEEALLEYERQLGMAVTNATNEAATIGFGRARSAAQALDIAVSPLPVLVPHDTLELASQLVPEFIQAEKAEVLKGVSAELRLAFAGGQDRATMISNVRARLTKTLRFKDKQHRAETIVRTEVNRIHNAAHHEGALELEADNIEVWKTWLRGFAKNPRHAHTRMSGVKVRVSDPFPWDAEHVGAANALPRSRWPMYPLDPVLPAEESINCHCTTVETFEITDEEDVESAIGVTA